MKKASDLTVDVSLNEKIKKFNKRIDSDMHFKSELSSNSIKFDWLDEIEFALSYIDNTVRLPKRMLIKEEEVVKIEKAKKVSVASIKNLSTHTYFIEKIEEKTDDVTPSRILIERNEETFNLYENRFIYSLIDNITRFVMKKESLLDDMEMKDDKVLEYAAKSYMDNERVKIEMKISSKEMLDNDENMDLETIRKRIKHIKDFIMMWKRSELIVALEKAHVPLVTSPIKKTNVILKNPNFQVAMKLWSYLQKYDDDDATKDNLDTEGNALLMGLLDDAFLMNYFVLDSISATKKEQKEKLSKYAVVMIHQHIQRVIALLLNNGIKITDKDILELMAAELKNEKNKNNLDTNDVKKKFQNALSEFLDKTEKL